MAWSPTSPLALAVNLAGFDYDPQQDIIYSRMDALQRNFGYAYAFDAFALGMSADLDCEPIFFEYDGKLWMIELWKGQYGLETGCEIGVYNRAANAPIYYELLDETIGRRPVDPDPAHGQFFACATDSELLEMSFTLTRDGTPLFSRGPEPHWWLTGFRWGVYSTPDQLAMAISITFPTSEMQQAFVQAIEAMGYAPALDGLTVTFDFTTPHAPQPPRDPDALAAVRLADQTIVATYHASDPTRSNNDPNTVVGETANAIASAVLGLAPDFFGAVLGDALRAAGRDAQAVAELLVNDLECALDAVADWITDAGYDLAEWIESIYAVLNHLFTMNFSTAVEIVNRPANGIDPPLLTLSGSNIDEGRWYVQPPAVIAPGTTRRFYLKDNLGPEGSEGWAEYTYTAQDGATQTVRFTFGCPTGFSSNYATATPAAPFGVYARSGDDTSWHTSVPGGGHPLNAAYVWAHGPAPA